MCHDDETADRCDADGGSDPLAAAATLAIGVVTAEHFAGSLDPADGLCRPQAWIRLDGLQVAVVELMRVDAPIGFLSPRTIGINLTLEERLAIAAAARGPLAELRRNLIEQWDAYRRLSGQ